MASSSSSNYHKLNIGSEYTNMPSSIISLPTRLQKKIQKETECKLNATACRNADGRKDEYYYKLIKKPKENDKELDQQKYKKDTLLFRNEKYQTAMTQSPRKDRRDVEVDERAKMLYLRTSSNPSIILMKEKNQHSSKDSFNNLSSRKTGHTTVGAVNNGGISVHHIEPPSWFKSPEILEKSDLWRHNMQELTNLHSKYFELLESDESLLENWSSVMNYRKEMNDIFTCILENNLKFCCKENIEMYFWKILYYNLIERLRRNMQQLQQQPNNTTYTIKLMIKDIRSKAIHLINDGFQFYENKIIYLEQKYFPQKCSSFDVGVGGGGTSNQKFELLAKILMQKILIHLGDLSRYKEQIDVSSNGFITAKQYYQRAQTLVPSNGIPYNQLAILAIYNKKTFDAIYYYMRSLCASNPIYSAKESLKELFDEIRKKCEDCLQQNFSSDTTIVGRISNNACFSNESEFTFASMKKLNLPMKKEIWVHPNGSKRLHRFDSNRSKQTYCFEDKFLKGLQSDELLKRFTSSYLYILGRLFTGIGMENFMKIQYEMLIAFKTLIFRNPLIFPKHRLLQIIALNIFIIENNRQKEKTNGNSNKEICNYAFNTSQIMFGIILNRLNEILKELFAADSSSDDDESIMVLKLTDSSDNQKTFPKSKNFKKDLNYKQIPESAEILLQTVKVWCDWLKQEITYWNPPKFQTEIYNFLNEYETNPWNALAQLVTLLSCVNFECDESKFKLETTNDVTLKEDAFLNGFMILNTVATVDDVIAEDKSKYNTTMYKKFEMIHRLRHIKSFGLQTLCECKPAVFEKVLDAQGAIVYIKSIVKENENSNSTTLESFENFDDDTDCGQEEESTLKLQDPTNTTETNNVPPPMFESKENELDDVLELIRRKQELERKTKQRQIYQQTLETLLENSETIFYIEVRPKYLIPDTNCFIDFLDLLKTITTNLKRYTLAIPTVVCNELEGLSKGFKISNISTLQATSSTIRHFDEVTIRAREALEFIRCKNNSSVKYVTTKGSILNTSNFIIEDNDDCERNLGGGRNSCNDDGGNDSRRMGNSNDDKILQTAESLCNRTNIKKKFKKKIFVQTDVVLLTTDRNLRVKALTRNLCVSQLNEFISWASVFEK